MCKTVMLSLNKIFYSLLAFVLILAGMFFLLVDHMSLPGRYGAPSMLLSPPTTYFVAALPLSFGISIILFLIHKEKYDSLCKKIILIGFSIGALGLVIIGPILNFLQK